MLRSITRAETVGGNACVAQQAVRLNNQELAGNRHSEGDRTVSTGRLAATYALEAGCQGTHRPGRMCNRLLN